jgi:hypothetical protein
MTVWCNSLSHHYICIVAVQHSHNGQFEVTVEFFFQNDPINCFGLVGPF